MEAADAERRRAGACPRRAAGFLALLSRRRARRDPLAGRQREPERERAVPERAAVVRPLDPGGRRAAWPKQRHQPRARKRSVAAVDCQRDALAVAAEELQPREAAEPARAPAGVLHREPAEQVAGRSLQPDRALQAAGSRVPRRAAACGECDGETEERNAGHAEIVTRRGSE